MMTKCFINSYLIVTFYERSGELHNYNILLLGACRHDVVPCSLQQLLAAVRCVGGMCVYLSVTNTHMYS